MFVMLRCRSCTATWLFSSADVILAKSCAAASEELQCNIEKAALQKSGAFLSLSCGLQAPTFRHPRLGPADWCTQHLKRRIASDLASPEPKLSAWKSQLEITIASDFPSHPEILGACQREYNNNKRGCCMRLCKTARFCAFLCVFAPFCAFLCVFPYQNGLQKSANLRRILQKCAKSAVMQCSLQLPPFACHLEIAVWHFDVFSPKSRDFWGPRWQSQSQKSRDVYALSSSAKPQTRSKTSIANQTLSI